MYPHLLPVVGLALLSGCSAASITKRSLTVSSNLPDGYSYLGCFQDSPQNRQLTGASYTDSTGMTEESCISFCNSNGFQEAGVEYSSECYCGHQFQSQPVQVDDSECNMACSGDSSEPCGAGNRLSVFSNGQSAPVTNPGTDGMTLIGCYTDSATARTLSNEVSPSGSSLTVSSCVDYCTQGGYTYAGVENGNECYCDTGVRNDATTSSGCDVTCSGNATEYCGGASRIDVYEIIGGSPPAAAPVPSGWTSLGCYNDNVSSRTLANMESVSGGMTVEGCLNACQGTGYSLAGVEYGQECWCDNQIENGAGPASDSSACHYPCRGNPGETCGGASVLNLYSYSSSSTTSKFTSVLTTTTMLTTTSIRTTTTMTPTSSPSVTTLTTTTVSTTPSLPTTSTTTTQCTASATTTGAYLDNGGFEQGLSGWTVSSYQGSFNSDTAANGDSYEGCREFEVTPSSSTSNNRQVSLSTYMHSLQGSYKYSVSAAIGRYSSASTTSNAPYVAIVVNQHQVGGGYVCGFANTGACPQAGNGGSQYGIVSAQFQAYYPNDQLQFVLSWIGIDVLNEEVSIDAVSVTFLHP